MRVSIYKRPVYSMLGIMTIRTSKKKSFFFKVRCMKYQSYFCNPLFVLLPPRVVVCTAKEGLGSTRQKNGGRKTKIGYSKSTPPAKTISNNNTPTGSPAAASDAPTANENDEAPSPS